MQQESAGGARRDSVETGDCSIIATIISTHMPRIASRARGTSTVGATATARARHDPSELARCELPGGCTPRPAPSGSLPRQSGTGTGTACARRVATCENRGRAARVGAPELASSVRDIDRRALVRAPWRTGKLPSFNRGRRVSFALIDRPAWNWEVRLTSDLARVAMLNPAPDLPILPYDTIKSEFENLLISTINNVEREWPAKWSAYPGAAYVVESVARITNNTHWSLKYLLAQEPPRTERKVEFALSAIPIVRSLLDSVFLLVFLFEDLPARSVWYLKGGWREHAEELARYKTTYLSDPEWKDWIAEFEKMVEDSKKLSGVTPAEAANLKILPYWPIPGAMLRSGKPTADDQKFLEHLNDWFYRNFSSHSHLSLPGLILRSAGLRPAIDEEAERLKTWRLEKQRSDTIAMEILMCLCVMSEIEIVGGFGLGTRPKYVWGIANGFFGFAKEIYQLRYEKSL
jgi:hypothetical protein